MQQELVVLVGRHEDGTVEPGDTVSLGSLGTVEVAGVQTVAFADGTEQPCLVFPASILDRDMMFEPATLDGTTLSVTPRWS